MQKTLDVLMLALFAGVVLYVLVFAVVGTCLVGSNQPVSECRDNMAGQVVYQSVSLILQ